MFRRLAYLLFAVQILVFIAIAASVFIFSASTPTDSTPTSGLDAAPTGYIATTGNAAAGPPYPDPVDNKRVYDYAGIFSPEAIASAQNTIWAIQNRTGVQIAIYTQVKPESDTLDLANGDARALMDQWGVGRKGFDDGLVIMFDMQENRRHGMCSLYAGSGFRAVYLTDADRQSIFDNDMKPLLTDGDFDGALAIALADIDKAATPEHRDSLNRARIINASVGFGVLIFGFFLIGLALLNWWRVGRDPVYTDDSSVLMPEPPDGLTPAMATLLMSDRCSKRTVAAGLVDLASQGLVQFKYEKGLLSSSTSIGATGDRAQGGLRPEEDLWRAIKACTDSDGFVDKNDTASGKRLYSAVKEFKNDLEQVSVKKGWMAARPSSAVTRWVIIAVVEFVGAGFLAWWTYRLDASGGFLGTVGLGAAGIATLCIAPIMPSRTLVGSMLRAMLSAYKRTLQYTLRQSQSMTEVVEKRPLPWVTTPDAAMAWGVAFGLDREIDAVMKRTVEGLEAAGAAHAATVWYPTWYFTPGHAIGSGFAGGSAGLYSSSAIPDIGSMASALGSIGSTGSSSGSSGSYGGGGGGGGGGAGGGF